ncbi:MAG: hypothetical protein JWM27_3305 [Gemmatimonadetes bacterium]|nr:hypothetical protein [Gemmatimonadota bacterium]
MPRALSAGEVLRVWEAGADQHPLDRALTLLSAAEPRAARAELAALSVAERDARLLRMRAAMLGPTLSAFAACPRCGERLEFTLRTDELTAGSRAADGPWETAAGGVSLRFRLPDSRDLAAAARSGSVDAARRVLGARCVLAAWNDAGPVDAGALSEDALTALAAAMGEVAPEAEVSLSLGCPACGGAWESLLDVADFFWTELSARARRVMQDVHVLARAYHWSEAEILALSPGRRRAYLEMAEG